MNKLLILFSFLFLITSTPVLVVKAYSANSGISSQSKIEFTEDEDLEIISEPISCGEGEEKDADGKCVPKEG